MLTVVVVEDKCFFLCNVSVFIELWEVDVMQSDNVLCLELARQHFDSFCPRGVLESDSLRQAGLLDKATRGA
jgi:hypothetical protein